MARKLIERNGKKYKLHNEALRKLIMPDGCEQGLESRIRDIIQTENMGDMLGTIKQWFYNNNGTSDIESLEKIAHYYHVPVETLLIETDEVWEHFEKANSISEKRTYEASLENIKNGIIKATADDPNYKKGNGLKGIRALLPKGISKILIAVLLMIWALTFDLVTVAQIAPGALFLIIEFYSFFLKSYFKKEGNLYRNLHFVRRFSEIALISIMIKDILIYYLIL